MVKNKNPQQTASWLKLFLASKEAATRPVPISERPPGRPRKASVTEKTTIYLSESDKQILQSWKSIFSSKHEKKVYGSEVVQIMFRIMEDRLQAIGGSDNYSDLESLYNALVNAPVIIEEDSHLVEEKTQRNNSRKKNP